MDIYSQPDRTIRDRLRGIHLPRRTTDQIHDDSNVLRTESPATDAAPRLGCLTNQSSSRTENKLQSTSSCLLFQTETKNRSPHWASFVYLVRFGQCPGNFFQGLRLGIVDHIMRLRNRCIPMDPFPAVMFDLPGQLSNVCWRRLR